MAETRSFRTKHQALYTSERECARYDVEVCRRQDHSSNLLPALRAVAHLSPHTTRVADIGAGTGKLTRLLAEHVAAVTAIDRSAAPESPPATGTPWRRRGTPGA